MSRSYDPVRLGAPDGLVAEVDGVTGRRYKATGGGMYEMHPRDAAAFKREGAFVPSIGGPTTRGGYTCPGCGFRAVVRLCSRCGQRCETDAERRARLACPTCSGPIRETVDMVCRTCGTDYASAPQDWAEPAREIVDLMRNVGGYVVMEYEINTATGDVRETGPARREVPIETRPQDWAEPARETVFGPAHTVVHIDPRYARAVLAADAARQRIYRDGRH